MDKTTDATDVVDLEEQESLTTESIPREDEVRGTWQGQFESALTLVGYSVGIGNIWRFPYLCYKNGGGAFVIPFLLFLLICGLPLFYMEICLGQFSGKSPMHVWAISPLFRGIGVVMLTLSTLYCWYYGMIIGWVYYYLIQSFYPTLGWSTCNNTWNTPNCIEIFSDAEVPDIESQSSLGNQYNIGYVNTTGNRSQTHTAATEFWEHNVLGKSSGIDDMGTLQWHLVGSLMLGWIIVFFCLAKGVKTVGKVVYVTVLAPYVLLTILLVRGITLNGAWDGLKLYLYPDFTKLADPQIWQDAAVQVFYSLGPAWGGVITMSSFNKFHHNARRDAMVVCFADAFTAIFAGLPVFAVLGYMSKETGKPIDYFKSSGPGLVFIAYPEALSTLPLPQFWSVLFFFTLVFVGIDTMFTTFETVSATIIDLYFHQLHKYKVVVVGVLITIICVTSLPLTMSAYGAVAFHQLHKYKVVVVGVLITIICVTSLPLTMSGGYYVLLLMDWYIGTFNVVITALIEVIVVAWIYGADRFSADIELMIGKRPPFILRLVWVFCVPVFVGSINLMTFISYSAPDYGKDGYVFPDYAVTIGTMISILPVCMIPIGAIFQLIKQPGSFLERLKVLTMPSSDWGPNDSKLKESYSLHPYIYERNFMSRIKKNVLGLNRCEQATGADEVLPMNIKT